ncbi:MAG: glutamate synthase subunit beta [Victivallaceae bacterium]|nr:glutamate synthase subunit beta [Victivallaceae bacterium]
MNSQEKLKNTYRPVSERLRDFKEVERPLSATEIDNQAQRCQDCGIPFCHGAGCPLCNVIPEMNAAVAAGKWRLAWDILSSTNQFPEFTSRICPALCEASCTRGINGSPVMIRQLEKAVVETAFNNGWVTPVSPRRNSGCNVAVVGSGPAGLAVADELSRCGHAVIVYEKNAAPGGLLRYGIPDFKLEKNIIDRRLDLMKQSGIKFECATEVGQDIKIDYLRNRFDAVIIAAGAPAPRNLDIPGRELNGIHFALDFLGGQNRFNAGEISELLINAKNKKVMIIGGGDTGSDCIGTALRQGAKATVQVEIMPQPPECRSESTPWPDWPYQLKTSSSHLEGTTRLWSSLTKSFEGADGNVKRVQLAKVEWEFSAEGKPLKFREALDTEQYIEADLVLLALGFTTDKSRVEGEIPGFYICGDAATGQSLVVKAMDHARKIAQMVDKNLSNNGKKNEIL